MATYWHKHPRGFANECSIYRAETQDQADWLASHGYDRLTRAQAIEHVRWLNGEPGQGRYDVAALVSKREAVIRSSGWDPFDPAEFIAEVNTQEAEDAAYGALA